MAFSEHVIFPWEFFHGILEATAFGPEFEAPNTGAIPSSSCTSQGQKPQPPKKAQFETWMWGNYLEICLSFLNHDYIYICTYYMIIYV
jgi:hypothetical protein